jgi:hypothetical protein
MNSTASAVAPAEDPEGSVRRIAYAYDAAE